ncbi:MAG TPA: hypothetical protein VGH13_23580, partial [Xanthobacteraceae bacterium]
MSSPSRAAKPRAKARASKVAPKAVVKITATKTATTRSAAKTARPAKPTLAVANGVSAEAKRLAATLERSLVDGKFDLVSAEALQAVMAAACRLYTARVDAGEQFMPVPPRSISATDVMVTA